MKKIAKKIILSVLSLTAILTTSAYAADLSGWAVAEYQSANQAGLVPYSVVSHNLKEDITRQEFCELAMNLYSKPTNEQLETFPSPFIDTDSQVVAQAYFLGIAGGSSENEFSPNRAITREEMAKMLTAVLDSSEIGVTQASDEDKSVLEQFDDAGEISGWAKPGVITALKHSLMNGITSDTFSPRGTTSREQAIASVTRCYNAFKSDNYSVALPQITLPANGAEIEEGDFTISWTSIPSANSYHVIIKDAGANSVVLEDIYSSTAHVIKAGTLATSREYTLIVGAVLADGSEVYSMPVDFTYKAKRASSSFYEGYQNQSYMPPSQSSSTATSSKAQAILDTAAQYLGVPYLWGGTTPSGFDCSGFVQYVFKQNGINLTRTTYTQWDNDGVYVSRSELQPGDLVYFGSSSAPHHVGIYVGNGQYIHSPRTGDVVKYASLDSRSDFCGGKRVL